MNSTFLRHPKTQPHFTLETQAHRAAGIIIAAAHRSSCVGFLAISICEINTRIFAWIN